MAAEAGKGSKPRPYSIDFETFDSNWERIFGRDKKSSNESKSPELNRDKFKEEDQNG